MQMSIQFHTQPKNIKEDVIIYDESGPRFLTEDGIKELLEHYYQAYHSKTNQALQIKKTLSKQWTLQIFNLPLFENEYEEYLCQISDGFSKIPCRIVKDAAKQIQFGIIKNFSIITLKRDYSDFQVLKKEERFMNNVLHQSFTLVIRKCQVQHKDRQYIRMIGDPLPYEICKEKNFWNENGSLTISKAQKFITIKQLKSLTQKKASNLPALRAKIVKIPKNVSGGFLNIDLQDQNGDIIQASCFDYNEANAIFRKIKLNQTYIIHHYLLKKNSKNRQQELKLVQGSNCVSSFMQSQFTIKKRKRKSIQLTQSQSQVYQDNNKISQSKGNGKNQSKSVQSKGKYKYKNQSQSQSQGQGQILNQRYSTSFQPEEFIQQKSMKMKNLKPNINMFEDNYQCSKFVVGRQQQQKQRVFIQQKRQSFNRSRSKDKLQIQQKQGPSFQIKQFDLGNSTKNAKNVKSTTTSTSTHNTFQNNYSNSKNLKQQQQKFFLQQKHQTKNKDINKGQIQFQYKSSLFKKQFERPKFVDIDKPNMNKMNIFQKQKQKLQIQKDGFDDLPHQKQNDHQRNSKGKIKIQQKPSFKKQLERKNSRENSRENSSEKFINLNNPKTNIFKKQKIQIQSQLFHEDTSYLPYQEQFDYLQQRKKLLKQKLSKEKKQRLNSNNSHLHLQQNKTQTQNSRLKSYRNQPVLKLQQMKNSIESYKTALQNRKENQILSIDKPQKFFNCMCYLEILVDQRYFIYGQSLEQRNRFFQISCQNCKNDNYFKDYITNIEIQKDELICNICGSNNLSIMWNLKGQASTSYEVIDCGLQNQITQKFLNLSAHEGYKIYQKDRHAFAKYIQEFSYLYRLCKFMPKIVEKDNEVNVYYNILEIYQHDQNYRTFLAKNVKQNIKIIQQNMKRLAKIRQKKQKKKFKRWAQFEKQKIGMKMEKQERSRRIQNNLQFDL